VILQPTTVYGVSKVYTELMGNYFHKRFNLDFRALRYPGAVSSDPPGGGTTDYAVEIFFELIQNKTYECFLSKNTMLPMMYIDDLIRGTINFIDYPNEKLNRRVYNLAAFSFTPGELFKSIKKHIPEASIVYKPDHRQAYADSWPMSIDDSCARHDWGWKHEFGLDQMTEKMIKLVSQRLNIRL
jgi:threonine 3-dehydrogenase